MKKKYLQVLSLFLTVSMLAGCGGGARTLTFSNNLNGNGEVEDTAETAEADTEEEASELTRMMPNELYEDFRFVFEGLRQFLYPWFLQ